MSSAPSVRSRPEGRPLDPKRTALVLALLVVGGACRRSGENAPEAHRRVSCAEVEPMTVVDTIELRGTVAPLPDRDAQVSAQVPGRVLRLLVREGDRVAAGQVLAKLDDGPFVDDLHAAEAALTKTRVEVRNAEATSARVERVYEHGIAAKQEVDDARARAQSAGAAASEAEAAARRAQRQVERSAIRSPLAGVIVRLLRRPGELVDGTPTTPIVEVADPSRLELVADVPAADLVRLQKDQTAEVSISALPGTPLTAEVAAVSPSVDRATGLGVVRVALPAGSRLPIGVLGTARVQVGAARASVGVPSPAVRSGVGGDVEVVLCGADGQAHVRRLPHGTSRGGRTETPGLEPGQRVVVSPVLGIADGDPIEIEK
jgi:RND family efflux transporter MFP subunit